MLTLNSNDNYTIMISIYFLGHYMVQGNEWVGV
jgi:hypothetical protein